jgi:hypothetical protein
VNLTRCGKFCASSLDGDSRSPTSRVRDFHPSQNTFRAAPGAFQHRGFYFSVIDMLHKSPFRPGDGAAD